MVQTLIGFRKSFIDGFPVRTRRVTAVLMFIGFQQLICGSTSQSPCRCPGRLRSRSV